MSQRRRGYLYIVAASVAWGYFPIYFKQLQPSGALEILAHRVIWSAVFLAVLLAAVRRWRAVAAILRSGRTLGGVVLAGLLIGANWITYIYGVNTDRVVEGALGYFITPLIAVLFGVVLFGERLRTAQWVAVGVGTLAVAVLTVDYGQLPYIALALAVTFACYSLVKKRLGLPAAEGLLVETSALTLPALAYLVVLGSDGQATVGRVSAIHTALILVGGAITAVPLLLFAGAVNRIPLTSVGILQYLAPVLQLLVGVFAYHEPMPPVRLAGFCLVWVALILFTWDGLRDARRRPRATPGEVDLVGQGV